MKYQLVDKDTNEILTPHYIGLAPNGELYIDGMNVTDRYHMRRFTGLTDKNGVEIYEGDILKVPDLYETPENTFATYHYEKVYFEKFGFRTDGGSDEDDWDYMTEDCEVIGNIYENPELLERESK